MTLLVLNRRPIAGLIPSWLAPLAEDLILLTARKSLKDSGEIPAEGYREIVAVDDYDSTDTDTRTIELAKKHGVRRILSASEVDVSRAARARAVLGLPGQDLQSARAFRDKFHMKSLVSDAGIAIAPMREVSSSADLSAFAAEHGYPLVVKPKDSGGSVGVRVLGDAAAATRWAAEELETAKSQYMVEAWVSGLFHTVDGLMAGGRVLHIWPSRTTANLLTVTTGQPLLSFMLPIQDDLRRRIEKFVREVVAALPTPIETTAFHAEVFCRDDGRLVLCEIASRPGGCGHVPVYEKAFGINLFAASLLGQAGVPPDPDWPRAPSVMAGFAWFPPRARRLIHVPGTCPLEEVYKYNVSGRAGSRFERATSVSDNIAQAFVSGSADSDLESVTLRLAAWWRDDCVWDPET